MKLLLLNRGDALAGAAVGVGAHHPALRRVAAQRESLDDSR